MKRTLRILASQALRLKERTSGVTLFKPSGVKYSYPYIDLANQIMAAVVTYENKTVMTVRIDVKNDLVQVEGNVDGLEELAMEKIHSLICSHTKRSILSKTRSPARRSGKKNLEAQWMEKRTNKQGANTS